MKLKRNDKIIVTKGRDKNKEGTITRILPKIQAVIVEGVNITKRHTKVSKTTPKGGIVEIAQPMLVHKVALICPTCKKPTKIGYKTTAKQKERFCRKCQAVIK